MSKAGSEVKVIFDNCPIQYADGTTAKLRRGAIAGAFSDFVAAMGEGVEVYINHPKTGEPTTACVPANMVTIDTEW